MIDLIDFSNCVLSTRNLQYAGRAREKRISILNFIRFKNEDFKKACNRVYKKVNEELENIEEMILSIPESFNGLTIMTENRKRYYIETFKIRINNILKICL